MQPSTKNVTAAFGYVAGIMLGAATLTERIYGHGGGASGDVHPTVSMAAELLKTGKAAEAIAHLRVRVDADPNECRGLALMVLSHDELGDRTARDLWLARINETASCAGVSHSLRSVLEKRALRKEVAMSVASAVIRGSRKEAEAAVTSAESELGDLTPLKLYIRALQGDFDALALDAQMTTPPSRLTSALKERQAALEASAANVLASQAYGFMNEGCYGSLPVNEIRRLKSSSAYAEHEEAFKSAGGRNDPDLFRSFLVIKSRYVREQYELAPLSEAALTAMMTLALSTASDNEVTQLAAAMRTAYERVSWLGFKYLKDSCILSLVTIDDRRHTVSYAPLTSFKSPSGTKRAWAQPWSIPIKEVASIRPRLKFVTNSRGYRSIDLESDGFVINGHVLPLPENVVAVGLAYGEVGVRQMARQYAMSISRLLNVPDMHLELVDAKPGRSVSLLQLLSAGMGAFSGATGNATMAGFWATRLTEQKTLEESRAMVDLANSEEWTRLVQSDGVLRAALQEGSIAGDVRDVLNEVR